MSGDIRDGGNDEERDPAAGQPGDASGAGAVEPAGRSSSDVPARFPDPGLPPHQHRRTDSDPRAARKAELQVSAWFLLSVVGTIIFIVGFFAVPLDYDRVLRLPSFLGGSELNRYSALQLSTAVMGGGMALALFCIGIGAVHWAKKLMPDDEVVEERHPIRSTDEEQRAAGAVLAEGGAAAGFPRRRMIWGSLVTALAVAPAMAVVPLWGLWIRGKDKTPSDAFSTTVWKGGMRLVTDPDGRPVKAADIPIGGVVHVLPEVADADGHALPGVPPEALDEHGRLTLNEESKAVVLLIRLQPDELNEKPERQGWSYNGIVAFSKICTHVGCPVALYEQTTHHLLCPCHQSTFDVRNGAERIFGPAKRPLPQLAITVDQEGYLVSQQGFTEPVGPSFWERG